MMNKLSTQPPKGTADWWPEEYAIRKYIFDTWRSVCTRFGYQEYLTPLVESADIYRAKSGEDVGGKELTVFQDRGGRELAIRPEMTPSVTRMVAEKYESLAKPIRLFSIANFFRNEKPQRGRNREFWQLNFDIFGSDDLNADVETLQIAIEIMLAFGATKDQFQVRINDRDLINSMATDLLKIEQGKVSDAIRLLDRFGKIENDELTEELKNLGADPDDWDEFYSYLEKDEKAMQSYGGSVFKDNEGIERMEKIWKNLADLGYSDYFTFSPSMVRGFDYYDGMVFEVFDLSPDNNRSLFGGGRYNGLAGIFGSEPFPAVGCAPGDETTRLFLESWDLLANIDTSPEIGYLPILSKSLEGDAQKLAATLRKEGMNVVLGLEEQKLGKALEYADKQDYPNVVIFGEDERLAGKYKLKNMADGTEEDYPI
jgi:histidyl-tRNA synthetase